MARFGRTLCRGLVTALVLAGALSGCAPALVSFGAASDTDDDLAIVTGQIDRSRGFANFRSYTLIAVDDVMVRHGSGDPRDTIAKVPPGRRWFVVRAAFNIGFASGGPWEAEVFLYPTLQKGKTYRITGEVREERYFVWLEDPVTGTRESEEASAPYQVLRANRSGGAVPIFIPIIRR